MTKKDFKNERKIQNALITCLMPSRPYFGHQKNCQEEHYFPADFL